MANTLRIGSVDIESKDPGIVRLLAELKSKGVDISNPSAISIAADGLFKKAVKAAQSGDKELAEDCAHQGARAMVAAITLKRVQPALLKEPTNLLIDTGATKLQHAKEAPAPVVDIPPPADLVLPPGPGAGAGTVAVVPDTQSPTGVAPAGAVPAATITPQDVQVGVSTGTIVGVVGVGILGWLAYKKFFR